MGVHQNVRIGAMYHEPSQGLLHVATLFAAGVQLAVAVGARPTLAKTVIGVGVDNVLTVQSGQISAACTHVLASLNEDGTQALHEALKPRKQPCWSRTYNQDGWGILRHLGPRRVLRGRFFAPGNHNLGHDWPFSGIPTSTDDSQHVVIRGASHADTLGLTEGCLPQGLRVSQCFRTDTKRDL